MLDVSVRHRFGAFSLDASFVAAWPGVTALFGPSGSGKTTIVNAIAGLLRPDEGRIAINGDVVWDSARRIFARARKRRVGYVFQDARLFPHLSVRVNLEFGARRSGQRDGASAEFGRIVEMLGIGHLLDRRPGRLSGGERQRVALGRAVLSRPKILLLDEPLAALDQKRKEEIIPYFERLRDEARIPMVFVSHSLDEVTRLADDMVVLSDGSVAAQGPVTDVMSRLDLFPLTGRFEAGGVIVCRVEAHEPADRLSVVSFDGGRLWVPSIGAAPGAAVRLRVRARDVMLALDEPAAISANNVLPAVITDIRLDEGSYLDIQLSCGASRLIARITHRSFKRLGLAPGQRVFAVIKSVTVDRPVSVSPSVPPPANPVSAGTA